MYYFMKPQNLVNYKSYVGNDSITVILFEVKSILELKVLQSSLHKHHPNTRVLFHLVEETNKSRGYPE